MCDRVPVAVTCRSQTEMHCSVLQDSDSHAKDLLSAVLAIESNTMAVTFEVAVLATVLLTVSPHGISVNGHCDQATEMHCSVML